jgi:hypothetical protein
MSEDLNIDFENIKNASSKNILTNFDWIEKALKILLRDKKYENDLYQDCRLVIDIFCINEMASIPLCIYEESEYDINENLYDYFTMISELEIDIKLFILLAGESFFESDFYEYTGELSEEQVLKYLIHENYNKNCSILTNSYKNNYSMFKDIVKNLYFYDNYLEAMSQSESMEDCLDYPDILKLMAWADSGFEMTGE